MTNDECRVRIGFIVPSFIIPHFEFKGFRHGIAEHRRLPVTAMDGAVRRHANCAVGAHPDRERTVAIGAVDPRADVAIPRKDFPMGMAEAIAIAHGENHDSRLHGPDEFRKR